MVHGKTILFGQCTTSFDVSMFFYIFIPKPKLVVHHQQDIQSPLPSGRGRAQCLDPDT